MCSSAIIACHHVGLSEQTLSQQTSSPSGEMNGSRLWWSIPLYWMTPLSGNQDLTYPDATGHSWIASGPTKATVHPVERSGALQQPTCALVANVKRCQIMSTAVHSPSWGERGRLQRRHSADDIATKWLNTYKCIRQLLLLLCQVGPHSQNKKPFNDPISTVKWSFLLAFEIINFTSRPRWAIHSLNPYLYRYHAVLLPILQLHTLLQPVRNTKIPL